SPWSRNESAVVAYVRNCASVCQQWPAPSHSVVRYVWQSTAIEPGQPKHLIPKKLWSFAVSWLPLQPDSRIACATVTDAGTSNSARPSRARAPAASPNCAVVIEAAGGAGSAHTGTVPLCTYAWEM